MGKIRLFSTLAAMAVCLHSGCMSQTVRSENTVHESSYLMPDRIPVKIDTVAFEANEKRSVWSSGTNNIGYYQRFDNPNSDVKSCRIFSTHDKLILTLVPTYSGNEINLNYRNSEGKTGKISITLLSGIENGKITEL